MNSMSETGQEQGTRELVALAIGGNRQAFDNLWVRYRKRIFVFLYRRTGSFNDAEDLCQQTFIRAWVALSSNRYEERSAFSSWLYQIANNVGNDWTRRQGPEAPNQELAEDEPEGSVSLTEQDSVAHKMLFDWLSSELEHVLTDSITAQQGQELLALFKRLAFVAYYVDGCTLPEIGGQLAAHAQLCGVAPPTTGQLNNWLRRGDILGRLMQHLVDEHLDQLIDTVSEIIGELDLSDQHRSIAGSRWLEGLSISEIGDTFQLSEAEVDEILEEALRKLVAELTAEMKKRLHDVRHHS